MYGFDENFNKIPIDIPCGDVVFSDITNDSIYFYFLEVKKLERKSCVYKYDENFNYITKIWLEKKFDNLYFNNQECIFYGSVKGDNLNIYKLDSEFNEIGKIKLNQVAKVAGVIKGITFNCCKNTIIITYESIIIEFNKCGDIIDLISAKNEKFLFSLEMAPLKGVMRESNGYKGFTIYFPCGECIDIKVKKYERAIAGSFSISFKSNKLKIFILFITKNTSYVRVYTLCLSELICIPDKCNLGDVEICAERKYGKPNSIKCDSEIEKSIANIENAISKILTSESKKILKVIQSASSTEEIIKVNESVIKTIKEIKELEEILVEKLKVSKGIKCDDKY